MSVEGNEANSSEEKDSISEEEKLSKAQACKDEGNEKLKQGDYEAARTLYYEGLAILDKAKDANTLKLALCLNLSHACIKTQAYCEAITAATKALSMDEKNVKALYRRGIARINERYLEDAKEDLREVLRLDPKNADATRELLGLKKMLQDIKAEEKKSFGAMFSKATLYEDKEREAQERAVKEYEMKLQRETEWKESNRKRKERGEAEQSLEDYIKEVEEGDKIKEEEKRQKIQPPPPQKPLKSPKKADSDDHLDEEDMKIINETKKMGYCYFGKNSERPPPPADFHPQKITPHTATAPGPSKPVSSWNAAGTTYEERDCTTWCTQAFQKWLMKSSAVMDKKDSSLFHDVMKTMSSDVKNPNMLVEEALLVLGTASISVTKVEDLTGEAHIAIVRTQPKYIFDFHCTLKFEFKIRLEGGYDDVHDEKLKEGFKYEGQLKLPDVSSSEKDYEMILSWNKPPVSSHKTYATSAVEKLKDAVKTNIANFLIEYRANYEQTF